MNDQDRRDRSFTSDQDDQRTRDTNSFNHLIWGMTIGVLVGSAVGAFLLDSVGVGVGIGIVLGVVFAIAFRPR